MDDEKLNSLRKIAVQIRKDALEMVYSAGNGNIGTALSSVEILTLLYFDILNIRPEKPMWEDRDRFILSKGHAAPAFYSVLSHRGYFDSKELSSFRKFNSRLQTHPEYKKLPGVDFGSGSLGQGLSAAVGMALACRYLGEKRRIFVLMGDGEIQEGQVWEAAMAGSHFKLEEITAIVDNNRLQAEGKVKDIMNIEPLADKWLAFGWEVRTADGHSFSDLKQEIMELDSIPKPALLISNTVKGKGISFMEGSIRWHLSQGMTRKDYETALNELNKVEMNINGRNRL